MFYNLPTEDVAGQGRFIRIEDLIEGIQEFKLHDVPLDQEYPFKILIRVYLQTIDKEEEIALHFSTKESRDVAIGTMLRDLWQIVKDEPEAPIEEKPNAKDRRPMVRKREPLGDA